MSPCVCRAVLAATQERAVTFLSWGVKPGCDIQLIADRLGLAVNPFIRALPNGGHVACRVVGLQQVRLMLLYA